MRGDGATTAAQHHDGDESHEERASNVDEQRAIGEIAPNDSVSAARYEVAQQTANAAADKDKYVIEHGVIRYDCVFSKSDIITYRAAVTI